TEPHCPGTPTRSLARTSIARSPDGVLARCGRNSCDLRPFAIGPGVPDELPESRRGGEEMVLADGQGLHRRMGDLQAAARDIVQVPGLEAEGVGRDLEIDAGELEPEALLPV